MSELWNPFTSSVAFSKRRAQHLRLGQSGEKLAARLLAELGLDILVRNYEAKRGEIDLIARDGRTLCFVEVKTRRRALFSRPADAVGREKRRHIVKAANQYMRELGHPQVPYRYDIVEAIMTPWRIQELCYWPNAFTDG